VRPALRLRLRLPENQQRLAELVEDPRRVATLDDHDLLYASPRMLSALDFLRSAPLAAPDWNERPPGESPGERLEWLVSEVRAIGSDVLYVDLTPPDMRHMNLYTARALLLDFQPIDFGWGERRLGGGRLYDLPLRLGLGGERLRPEQLNVYPHPLA